MHALIFHLFFIFLRMTASVRKNLIKSQQKADCNGYIVSGRIDSNSYEVLISLCNLGGYESVSSFVRKAVLEKCHNMSNGLTSMFSDRLNPDSF